MKVCNRKLFYKLSSRSRTKIVLPKGVAPIYTASGGVFRAQLFKKCDNNIPKAPDIHLGAAEKWLKGSRDRSNFFTHYTSKHLKSARHIKQGVTSQAFEECQQSRVGTCLHKWTVLVNGYYNCILLHMFVMPNAAITHTHQLDKSAKSVYETVT